MDVEGRTGRAEESPAYYLKKEAVTLSSDDTFLVKKLRLFLTISQRNAI